MLFLKHIQPLELIKQSKRKGQSKTSPGGAMQPGADGIKEKSPVEEQKGNRDAFWDFPGAKRQVPHLPSVLSALWEYRTQRALSTPPH